MDVLFSEIDINFVKRYLRIEEDCSEDDMELQMYLEVAKQQMRDWTGLTDDELDEINHIANIAVMKLVSNFYQVKSITVDAQTRDDLGFHLIMKMCRKHGIG